MVSVILMVRSVLNLTGINGILALDCNCFSVFLSSSNVLKIEVKHKLSFSLCGYLILTELKIQYTSYSLLTFSITVSLPLVLTFFWSHPRKVNIFK